MTMKLLTLLESTETELCGRIGVDLLGFSRNYCTDDYAESRKRSIEARGGSVARASSSETGLAATHGTSRSPPRRSDGTRGRTREASNADDRRAPPPCPHSPTPRRPRSTAEHGARSDARPDDDDGQITRIAHARMLACERASALCTRFADGRTRFHYVKQVRVARILRARCSLDSVCNSAAAPKRCSVSRFVVRLATENSFGFLLLAIYSRLDNSRGNVRAPRCVFARIRTRIKSTPGYCSSPSHSNVTPVPLSRRVNVRNAQLNRNRFYFEGNKRRPCGESS